MDCPGLGGDSLDLLPSADITVCCLAVGNTQVYGPTLTPIGKSTPHGHEVAYGDTSGIHEMTVALLGISRSAERWEQLGLGAAHEIHHRSLVTLQQAQRLPAHRRPPHPFVLGACYHKLSLFHPSSQRQWLCILHDDPATPPQETRSIKLRGFSYARNVGWGNRSLDSDPVNKKMVYIASVLSCTSVCEPCFVSNFCRVGFTVVIAKG